MTREEIHIGDVVKYDDHPNYLYKITRKQPNGSFVLNCIKGSYHCIPYALADKMTLVKSQPEPKFNLDKSLEEEIERYLHSLGLGHGGWVDGLADDDLRNLARHFAEWQKTQMLKDAVEGEVYLYHSYNRDATAILVDIPRENLGDKVRIIVVKDESK